MTTARATLVARWGALSLRERRLVVIMAALLLGALFWTVGLKPALRELQEGPGQRRTLQDQLARMQTLASQTAEWRTKGLGGSAPPAEPSGRLDQATRNAFIKVLDGRGQVETAGDQVIIRFEALGQEALRELLATARSRMALVLQTAEIERSPQGLQGRLTYAPRGN